MWWVEVVYKTCNCVLACPHALVVKGGGDVFSLFVSLVSDWVCGNK